MTVLFYIISSMFALGILVLTICFLWIFTRLGIGGILFASCFVAAFIATPISLKLEEIMNEYTKYQKLKLKKRNNKE